MCSVISSLQIEHLRAKPRVQLNVPVLFEWIESGRRHRAPGMARDVSSKGLYVISRFSPPLANIARCHLVLPCLLPEEEDLIYEAVLIGRVSRVDFEADRQVGFAVHARTMILREPRT